MSYLEKLTKFFEYYILAMLTICAILLAILVYNTSDTAKHLHELTNQLSSLELIEYGND